MQGIWDCNNFPVKAIWLLVSVSSYAPKTTGYSQIKHADNILSHIKEYAPARRILGAMDDVCTMISKTTNHVHAVSCSREYYYLLACIITTSLCEKAVALKCRRVAFLTFARSGRQRKSPSVHLVGDYTRIITCFNWEKALRGT